ncbi:MAG: M20 family metallopeptidase [Negativicutes bacterium]|nr:M20 family metallopeptidase [Negativicutes bacterium]
MNRNRLDEIIDSKRDLFLKVSDTIWDYSETRFQEVRSAELLCTVLEAEGFTVQRGVAGLATAFVASFGSGTPVVAVLGEYDALSGLSQKSGVARPEPLTAGGNGHGCGHNMLGAGALAAAVAVKHFLDETGLGGTIRYYGCPAEEGGSGKAFMVRAGAFDDVDVALTWHPLTHNAIFSVNTLANYQVRYQFHGRSAHAGFTPHLGRSALDAVELMNVGVNYLREHIIPEARVHYAVTNSGGDSPNVVQAEAEVRYLIRAPQIGQLREIYARVCDIARGAALMTGTECEFVFEKGCSNFVPNRVLEKLLYENFIEVGAPVPDEQDLEFAAAIRLALSEEDIASDLAMAGKFMAGKRPDIVKALQEKRVADVILPYEHLSLSLPGSTDVGDVSWVVPTAQLSTACNAFGTPGHSWHAVAQGRSGIAHKGMLTAGKVLARTAAAVLTSPAVAVKAKEELRESLGGAAYVCPIPAEVKPPTMTAQRD